VPFFAGISDAVSNVVDQVSDAAAAAAVPAARGRGILRIEPDQVDAAIGVFQSALDKLQDRVHAAVGQIEAQPPAQDLVSQPAATAFNNAARGGSGGAIQVWLAAVDELQAIIAQLQQAKETNVATDQAVSQPFASGLQTA
jgi:hypothetical protein